MSCYSYMNRVVGRPVGIIVGVVRVGIAGVG